MRKLLLSIVVPLLVLLQVFLLFVDKVLFIGVLLALAVLLALIFLLHTFGCLWDSGLFGQCMVLLVFCGALACLSRLVPQPRLFQEIQQQEEQETRAILVKGLPTPYPRVKPNPSLFPPHITFSTGIS